MKYECPNCRKKEMVPVGDGRLRCEGCDCITKGYFVVDRDGKDISDKLFPYK